MDDQMTGKRPPFIQWRMPRYLKVGRLYFHLKPSQKRRLSIIGTGEYHLAPLINKWVYWIKCYHVDKGNKAAKRE